jgi:hypothetical protein
VSTLRAEPGWADVLIDEAAEPATAQRLVAQLRACQAAALSFCRLLERWSRGEAQPSTAGAREAALRRAAERAETALAGLEQPLGQPGRAELVEWEPVLRRAGVVASPVRVTQAYLELAVLVRALEGLEAAARIRSVPDRSSLWAGLFDLRENLLGRAVEDLRALAA